MNAVSSRAKRSAVEGPRGKIHGNASGFLDFARNDGGKITMRMLKRASCHVERSEASQIFPSSVAGIRNQRFFASLRMTPLLNASTVQPFKDYRNP
jgi:hypothetical protein